MVACLIYLNIYLDVYLSFELSEDVSDRINTLNKMYKAGEINKVLIPLPMLTVLRSRMGNNWIINSPFRCVRIEDRINKVISSTKFCI